ncbi:MAG: PSD1 domain-containing protein [Pirellulaceae bacterium]|nr:PSD1 domain-containing protein [Pirellulaceae bacterium]
MISTGWTWKTFSGTAVLVFLVGLDLFAVAGATQDDRVQFARDIRPILSQNCFACHGFDENTRAADLRLDLPMDPESEVIVPGEPDESELVIRLLADADSGERMPPVDSHLEVTTEQIELIRRWIEQGAEYDSLWSLVPPIKGDLPNLPVELAATSKNEIDHWVRQRLLEKQLEPAPEADRATLIRRLSLDLVGLPPTAAEVAMFVNDSDPRAYENLVVRLLASPHFGERLALDWLDVARYADTNGYSIDGGRSMWLWRDWVIQSFNDNVPYDQFLIEQLAGDLLPNKSERSIIATGFQRNHMITHEGGTIPEENLLNYNADRVKTFGEAVLGLTLGCAQCHNHKYDPISQAEYYQLYAFFNSIDERGLDGDGGRNSLPHYEAATVLKADGLDGVRQRIAELEKTLETIDRQRLDDWEARQQQRLKTRGQDFTLHDVEVLNVTTPNLGSGFAVDGKNGVRFDSRAGFLAFDISARLPETNQPIRGVRVTFPEDESLPGNGWGRGIRKQIVAGQEVEKGTFVLTAISLSVDSAVGEQVNLYGLRAFEQVTASSWDDNFLPRFALDTRYENGWSPNLSQTGPVHFTATTELPIMAAETPFLTLHLNFGHGNVLVPAKFSIQVFTGSDTDSELPADIISLLEKPKAERSDSELRRLWDYFSTHSEEMSPERFSLANHRERLRVFSERFSTMVMNSANVPRQTFVFHRGDYSQPRELVAPGVPAVLPGLPSSEASDRLALAQWVTMPSHPLTARVAVNRFWRLFFGSGIVSTPADFGSQGAWPSHPELLDWLAVDFQENGWDVKRLVYQIVTSATYRQSSFSSEEAIQNDPENVWLARGPRFRLSAELIRDQALAASGLFVPWLGGPSVNPYTPGDPWREVSHYGSTQATAQSFVQDHGEKLYRRSMYTYWKRTAPPPNLSVFDAPNREVCVVERSATTTPLQALVLLNDVQFVEAQRAFAERILQQPGGDESRLGWAFLTIFGRAVSQNESDRLLQVLQRERVRFRDSPQDGLALLNLGESKRNQELDPADHAAWTIVAAVLFNSSEFVTRN